MTLHLMALHLMTLHLMTLHLMALHLMDLTPDDLTPDDLTPDDLTPDGLTPQGTSRSKKPLPFLHGARMEKDLCQEVNPKPAFLLFTLMAMASNRVLKHLLRSENEQNMENEENIIKDEAIAKNSAKDRRGIFRAESDPACVNTTVRWELGGDPRRGSPPSCGTS
ncbi:hypothetical protein NHX12_022780 [Muraenolepis orangiensis]|uniref:Uncharacterized protein n=1 Tax=Muraenolepis orangiensis TaxID=630683 RepID=A0A9Q0EQT9_9TELE|nr:hypothetical protein NHX12_022780 [Muraenolepis orangiensis]